MSETAVVVVYAEFAEYGDRWTADVGFLSCAVGNNLIDDATVARHIAAGNEDGSFPFFLLKNIHTLRVRSFHNIV